MNVNRQARRCAPARVDIAESDLCSAYDGLLVDLDGTLIRGATAIPGAVEALAAAGLPVMYVTNNASKAPFEVAQMLSGLGFRAGTADVMTSAQAAIALAQENVAPGSRVLVVGAPSFQQLARQAGYEVVTSADEQPDVVFQGLSKELCWADLAEGALAIAAGARWIASNTDTTLPSERGLLPGNGSMVAALRAATGAEPEVAGKPGPVSMIRAAQQLGLSRPLVVGDRLDTDIAGACAADMDSLMVLTGVSSEAEARTLPTHLQPTYIADGLDALCLPAAKN